jgi:hypothetical protein
MVHEAGHGATARDSEEEAYDHTHIAVKWNKKLDFRSPRCFDIIVYIDESGSGRARIRKPTKQEEGGPLVIHPHIQPINNVEHAVRLFDVYHHKDGTPVQSEARPGSGQTLFYKRLRDASTLAEACDIAGVEIRTVADVKLLRSDIATRNPFVHLYPDHNWSLQLQFSRVLFLTGPSQTGKTQWAVHQFKNPLLVSHMDDLRGFIQDFHDGIVFDDMSFAHLPRTACIHLLDWDMQRSIHARYSNAIIPAKTRKIITSNLPFSECFPYDESGAIRNRVSKIHCVKPGETCFAVPSTTGSCPPGNGLRGDSPTDEGESIPPTYGCPNLAAIFADCEDAQAPERAREPTRRLDIDTLLNYVQSLDGQDGFLAEFENIDDQL